MNSDTATAATAPAAMARICILPDRAVVRVAGQDAEKFLGDLVTGDTAGARPGEARYAALLTPQGKVLFDFIVHCIDGGYLLDLLADSADDLAKRLSFYKLRAKVEVAAAPGLAVVAVWNEAAPPALPDAAPDPRLAELGFRAIVDAGSAPGLANAATVESDHYHAHRIRLGVPEAPADFAFGEVFPHDVAMDQLNGVAFAKGCFVGQEVVSRMEHRGTARRRVVLVEGAGALPPRGTPIESGGRSLGALGSTDGTRGIAIVRLDRAAAARGSGAPITAGAVDVALALPSWAGYTWPTSTE